METKNIKLILCDENILKKALEGNNELSLYLNLEVPNNWTEFGELPIQYALEKLNDPKELGWWTYFPIHKKDNKLIGTCGYKGSPNSENTVELGYEIIPDYRNKGFATEITNLLIDNAFSKGVKKIIAHTLAEYNPSTKVLAKCNFIKTQEIPDEEHGIIWKWELKR
ncbi:MAG: GNAT family protein [Candidatus Sericytochromatia bacterium]